MFSLKGNIMTTGSYCYAVSYLRENKTTYSLCKDSKEVYTHLCCKDTVKAYTPSWCKERSLITREKLMMLKKKC